MSESFRTDAQAYLAALVESSDDGIVSKDLNGAIQTWNKAAESIFGYTAAEVIGRSILLIIPPERHQEEADILARLVRGERIDHYETVRRRKDGCHIDVSLTVSPVRNAAGAIIGASKIVRDISAQKASQRALLESQERWRVTLQCIGDGVIATNPKAVVTFVNPVAAKLVGRPIDELVGRQLGEVFRIVNEETRQPVENPVDRVIREGLVVGLANHTVVLRPDGTECPIDDSAAPIWDQQGRLLGVVLVFRDITEQKHAEQRLHGWNAELEASVRVRTQELLRSQDRLRGLASQLSQAEQHIRRRLATDLHDYLAQLLALARIKLAQMKQRAPQDPVAAQTLMFETDTILGQCLQFTRTLMTQLSPPMLHDLGLIAALRWLAEQMELQGLQVAVQVCTQEKPAFTDHEADLLFQSVRELLMNVLKHSGVSRAVLAVRKQEPDRWLITVEDQGVGFDLASLPARPFGQHFGLFSIQERMEAMSGWCRIDSSVGRGTTVELGLVAAHPRTAPQAVKPEATTPVQDLARTSGRWRILLVDDHAMVRQGLRTLLDTYQDLTVVAEASDGEEAVQLATHYRPHAVVMDLALPKLNGIEATRRIKRASPNTVVVGLSVQSSPDTVQALCDAGGVGLLTKEQAAEELYYTIIRHLADM
ncbi:MAG TPA: PAS domain S-box protein [Nitrospira sp.]|nr:PAS domain S-box protein [Nitrospira sp.]